MVLIVSQKLLLYKLLLLKWIRTHLWLVLNKYFLSRDLRLCHQIYRPIYIQCAFSSFTSVQCFSSAFCINLLDKILNYGCLKAGTYSFKQIFYDCVWVFFNCLIFYCNLLFQNIVPHQQPLFNLLYFHRICFLLPLSCLACRTLLCTLLKRRSPNPSIHFGFARREIPMLFCTIRDTLFMLYRRPNLRFFMDFSLLPLQSVHQGYSRAVNPL